MTNNAELLGMYRKWDIYRVDYFHYFNRLMKSFSLRYTQYLDNRKIPK